MERLLIDGFNNSCSNIASSYLKVGDESISSIRFFTMSKEDLTCLTYIFCTSEPLGTELKKVDFSTAGPLIFLIITPLKLHEKKTFESVNT